MPIRYLIPSFTISRKQLTALFQLLTIQTSSNKHQYFEKLPPTACEFYISCYEPAQEWLKDCKERTLVFDDILHDQKIIIALTETDRLMKEFDNIEIE